MKFSNEYIPIAAENAPDLSLVKKGDLKTSTGFPCRDPFILPYDGKYYLYQSGGEKGLVCYVSDDLENWSQPVLVYKTPEDTAGTSCWYWAPECHFYKGNFYIFTSIFNGKYNHRIISCYRANNPLGPFEDISGGALSPTDWDAIDGTLYIDKKGAPWLVFVHEWTSMPEGNGSMVAARLSEDFTRLISEPIRLFYARDPEWAQNGVTDGPFMYRAEDGELFMIWSNFGAHEYVVGLLKSDNGEIDGKWEHLPMVYERGMRPEFTFDGGHGMFFRAFDGKTYLSLHTPNNYRVAPEHLSLFEIEEKDGLIKIK